MVPRPCWKQTSRNLRVGDVGHLKFPNKMGKPEWKICRVLQVHPDEKGVVRTVTVELRPRHIQDQDIKYKTKKHSY